MKRLLIVYHTQFGGTRQLAEAAWRGAPGLPAWIGSTCSHGSDAAARRRR